MHGNRRNEMSMCVLDGPQTSIGLNIKDPNRSIVPATQNVISRRMEHDAPDPVFVCAKYGDTGTSVGDGPQADGAVSTGAGEVVPGV
mmetsp:Transcript_27924/g.58670  ORF Transcript_27924/g.58670 Transcript_27924/m.58670 type:complete len:87 (+) Transcript_27924:309-569(+)